MNGRRLLLAACLLLGPAAAGAGEPERHPLLVIADAGDEGRDAALEKWKALSDAERTKQVRAALRSEDPALAFAAAVTASPWSLDLEESGLRSRAMERDPIAWFDAPKALADVADEDYGFGSADLLAIWKALGAKDPDPARIGYSRPHRSLLPVDVPALVPLLETAGPRAFRGLLFDLVTVAGSEAGDERHADYVRAFRYALRRLRAEAARRPRPKFADVPAPAEKSGLPAEFIELARGSWSKEGDGFDLGGHPADVKAGEPFKAEEGTNRGPDFWLHRWARRLEPSVDDAAFLLEIVESSALGQTKAWAARKIAAFEGRSAGHALTRVLAPGGGGEMVWAAAERALRGDREAWEEFVGAGKGLGDAHAGALADARWLVDPVAARAAAWDALRRGKRPQDLVQEDRWFLAYDYGVEIADEHLDWIAARLTESDAAVDDEMWFFAEVHPEWLTRERAETLLKRWTARAKTVETLNDEQRKAVALMEPLAPEATRVFLRAAAVEAEDEYVRAFALDLLQRLGDAALQERMLPEWLEGHRGDAGLLGRVRTPEVETFLRDCAEGRGPKLAEERRREGALDALAVEALAVFYGCPEPLARFLGPYSREDEELTDATWAEVKTLVLAKDPVGAVLRRTHAGPYVENTSDAQFAGFGLAQDPRMLERLRLWRDRREFRLYWVATACLAMQGEERARTEWGAWLAQARTFLLDDITLWRLFTLDGDPAWTDDWVARIDANCCYGWHAYESVKLAYPTLPYERGVCDGGRTRRGAERWFARHRGTFVRSPILDGWIPGPRR